MRCSKCYAENNNSSRFCITCGAPLQASARPNIPQAPNPNAQNAFYPSQPAPRKRSKKPLIISLVALILVAAILWGAIWLNRAAGQRLFDPVEGPEILIWRYFKGIEEDNGNYWRYTYDENFNRDDTGWIFPDAFDSGPTQVLRDWCHELHRDYQNEAGSSFTISYNIEEMEELEEDALFDFAVSMARRYEDLSVFPGPISCSEPYITEAYYCVVDVEVDGDNDSFDETRIIYIYLLEDTWYIEV